MKRIVYRAADGMLCVVAPVEGARLARHIVSDADGSWVMPEYGASAQPVDRFLRGWPIAGYSAEWAESEAQFLARIAARAVPADAADVRIVDAADIPADREYRNAWAMQGGAIGHDLERAKDVHRDRIRSERAPLLKQLDVDMVRAIGRGANKAERDAIETKKQALRDATQDPAIDAARSLDELRRVRPAALGDK